jgi:hypothetical protein
VDRFIGGVCCPEGPDDPICQASALVNPPEPHEPRPTSALTSFGQEIETGQVARAQFWLCAMGARDHTAGIMGRVDFLKRRGIFEWSKDLCSRLKRDTGSVFATLKQAFRKFGPPNGPVTINLTVSAKSL